MDDLRVTLVQTDLAWEDRATNLKNLAETIAALADPGDLIVLPEMFATGFSMAPQALAETMTGDSVQWLHQIATSVGSTVTGSLMIKDGGHYYNRLFWVSPDGVQVTYDKKHLFTFAGEDKVYTPGETPLQVSLKGWQIRPLICYDLRFPVWTRNRAPFYDLAIFVANWPAKRSAHWRALLKARAIENQAYVIGVNRVGSDGNGYDHSGDSAVITPLGETLFEAHRNECHHTATLSRGTLDSYRTAFPAWMDADHDIVGSSPE